MFKTLLPLHLSLSLGFMISCGTSDPVASTIKADHSPPPAFEDRTLDRVTFITSHNSFAIGIKALAPNQNWDVKTQLENGVRGFMLDIWSHKGKAVLCHGLCEIPIIKTNLSVSLEDRLRDFEDYMKKDKGAIITLHLEWTPSARVNEFEAALNKFPDLKAMIFDPYRADVQEKGWPKIRDMIASNKRLLILNQSPDTRHLGIGHDRDFTVENYWSLGGAGTDRSCRSRWDDIPLDRDNASFNPFRRLFVMNHFRDVPFEGASLIDNQDASLWGRIAHECLQSARRLPNFVALDHVDRGNGFGIARTLNEAVGIAFEHPNWGGMAQIIARGEEKTNGSSGKLKNDTMSSVEIFFKGTRVALFEHDDQTGFLRDVHESMSDIGEANDRVSSWRAD